jgi:hypothetical protein
MKPTHPNYVGDKGQFLLGSAPNDYYLKDQAKGILEFMVTKGKLVLDPNDKDPTYDCYGSEFARLDSSFCPARITRCYRDHGAVVCTHIIANMIYHGNTHNAI